MADVTLRGNPITLGGSEVKAGQSAPDFTALDNGLKPVKLSDAKGKVVILSSVPSLDTPTCDTETRRFNQEAAKLGSGVEIWTISRDLPFASGETVIYLLGRPERRLRSQPGEKRDGGLDEVRANRQAAGSIHRPDRDRCREDVNRRAGGLKRMLRVGTAAGRTSRVAQPVSARRAAAPSPGAPGAGARGSSDV